MEYEWWSSENATNLSVGFRNFGESSRRIMRDEQISMCIDLGIFWEKSRMMSSTGRFSPSLSREYRIAVAGFPIIFSDRCFIAVTDLDEREGWMLNSTGDFDYESQELVLSKTK